MWAGEFSLFQCALLLYCRYSQQTNLRKFADTNNMIILYPQAIPDDTEETIWYGGELDNPNGCWDWVGWYGANADQIGGALINIERQLSP